MRAALLAVLCSAAAVAAGLMLLFGLRVGGGLVLTACGAAGLVAAFVIDWSPKRPRVGERR